MVCVLFYFICLCLCVLLLLFNVLVKCGCELLCDGVRVVVLFLLVLVYVCAVLWFRNVFMC